MGVQPAGFKEGIGQKSVRKFKELTGIDAGPGKPFDKDIEFAGKPGCKSDQLKVKIEKAAKKSTPVEPQISIPHAPGFAKLEERQYSTKNPKHPMANAKKQALDFLDKHDSFRTHTTQNGIQQNVESICHLDTRDSGSNKFATEIQLHRAKNNKTTIGVVHYTDKLGSRSKRRVKDFYRNRTSYNSEWFK